MKILFHWIISALAVGVAAYLLPGVHVGSLAALFVAALVIGLLNIILKPILILLTLPVTVLTLGLFALVINGLIILLASKIVPGFRVDGFVWAILFSVVLSLVNFAFKNLETK